MTNPMLRRILVPLDGSAHAEAILSQLRRFLPRHESPLLLLHALPLPSRTAEEQTQDYLRKLSFQLTQEGYPSTSLLRIGSPAETILETAADEGASLIALSTHGRTGAARWVMGSVAEKVLQASSLPVLVARSFAPTACRGRLESLPIRNFLVPLDGSRLSLGALDSVLKVARPVDAHVTLLHVAEPSPYDGRWDPPDETLNEAEQILREACIPTLVEHRKGDPAEQILKFAEEKGMDLIAMTTHGRSGPSRWVFGSVTAKVLRSSDLPLLVVRQAVPLPRSSSRLLKHTAP